MIAVTLIHTVNPIPIATLPLGIMRARTGLMNFGFTTVSFYVSFVNDINAVFIAQIKKNRVGRVVRGTNAVYVVFLKNANILFHILD